MNNEPAHDRALASGRGACAATAILLLGLGGTAFAAPPKPVSDALALISASKTELAGGWRYRQRITGTQQSELLAYDASRPPGHRWAVLAINGKKSSPEKARQFEAQARQSEGKPSSRGLTAGVGSWLDASHYKLVNATGGQLIYRIEPRPGPHADASTRAMLKHMSGRFVVDRKDHHPVSLTLGNFESFSPRFGVEIKSFRLKITFKRLQAGDRPVVAQQVATEAKGKVFWIKSFDARTRVVLSDFAPAAASAPVPATH